MVLGERHEHAHDAAGPPDELDVAGAELRTADTRAGATGGPMVISNFMDTRELVSMTCQAIAMLPEEDQPAALRRLADIVEGQRIEGELPAFKREVSAMIAQEAAKNGRYADGVPVLDLQAEDDEALREYEQERAAGEHLPTHAEVVADLKRRHLL